MSYLAAKSSASESVNRTQTRPAFNPVDAATLLVLLLLVGLLAVVMSARQINEGIYDDYYKHMTDAKRLIALDWNPPFPHFLHAWLMASFYTYFTDSMAVASTVVSTLYYLVMAMGTCAILRRAITGSFTVLKAALLVMLTGSLLIVMPMNLLTPFNPVSLYLGYIAPSPYHNPTTILMKAFAVLQLPLAIRIFAIPDKKAPLWLVALTTILTVLALLGKPNYTMSMLPVLVLMGGFWWLILRQPVDWRLMLIGWIIPALPVLWWQYTMAFDTNTAFSGGIVFAPLQFFSFVEPNLWTVPIKLILSMLFPLGVVLLHPRAALKDTALLLTWSVYGVTLVQAYFLNQSGAQAMHGNFLWGAFVGLFVVFIYSWVYLLRLYRDRESWSWRLYLCIGLYMLHVVSGVFWFLINLLPQLR